MGPTPPPPPPTPMRPFLLRLLHWPLHRNLQSCASIHTRTCVTPIPTSSKPQTPPPLPLPHLERAPLRAYHQVRHPPLLTPRRRQPHAALEAGHRCCCQRCHAAAHAGGGQVVRPGAQAAAAAGGGGGSSRLSLGCHHTLACCCSSGCCRCPTSWQRQGLARWWRCGAVSWWRGWRGGRPCRAQLGAAQGAQAGQWAQVRGTTTTTSCCC